MPLCEESCTYKFEVKVYYYGELNRLVILHRNAMFEIERGGRI